MFAVPSKLQSQASSCERVSSEHAESSDIAACSSVAVDTADSKCSSLPQPSSVRRKGSLSRLPTPGSYMAGRTGMQTKPASNGRVDGSVNYAVQPTAAKLSSGLPCPAALDKRKTVTAIRSHSNYKSNAGPLKALPSTVMPSQPDSVDGVCIICMICRCLRALVH